MTDHEPLPPPEPEAPKAERPGRWPGRFAASALWRIAGVGLVATAVAALAVLAWALIDEDDTAPADVSAAEFFAGVEG